MTYQYQLDRTSNHLFEREQRATLRARQLFGRVLLVGQLKKLWARLTGQSRQLLFLGDVERTFSFIEAQTPVIESVRLEIILGSHSKADGFDREFYPLDRNTENRWVSVASGMIMDFMRFPPVELVQVGDVYYVIDGHHRVSTARALGYIYINARVTRWEVA